MNKIDRLYNKLSLLLENLEKAQIAMNDAEDKRDDAKYDYENKSELLKSLQSQFNKLNSDFIAALRSRERNTIEQIKESISDCTTKLETAKTDEKSALFNYNLAEKNYIDAKASYDRLDKNAKKLQEEYEEASDIDYQDEKEIEEEEKDSSTKGNKGKIVIKWIAGALVLAIVGTGSWHLCKNVNFKSAPKKSTTDSKGNIDKKEFDKLVIDYMAKNPTANEKSVRYYLAHLYQDSLDAELLYELTGIYDYAEITEEAFEKLVQSLYKNLKNKGLNVNCDDVRKLVAIINSDQLATDMPEFLTKLMGKQTSSEFLTDALKITSTIKTYNHKKYNLTFETEDLIKLSPYIYDLKSKSDLILIEDYVLRLNKVKGNAVAQNEIVAQLLKDLYDYDGALTNIESGIGLASTVAVDSMINYVSFNKNGVRLLEKETLDGLLVHNKLELYISNIYANLEKCNSKKLTK